LTVVQKVYEKLWRGMREILDKHLEELKSEFKRETYLH